MIQLSNASDQSSYVVQIDFTDESDDPTTPTAATWSLTDGDGDIVNSRDTVTISSLDSTVYVALSGDDLDYDESGGREENLRCFVVEGTYNSSLTAGTLPLKKAFKFMISDLPQV